MARLRSIYVSAFALLLLAACEKKAPEPAENAGSAASGSAALKTIRAGEVLADPNNPHLIHGTFYTGPAKPGEPTLESIGSGGACLIAKLDPGHPTMCKSDSECQATAPSGGYGYCIDKVTTNAGQAGQCWYKPGGDQYCAKRPPATPWPDGDHTTPDPTGKIDVGQLYAALPPNGPKQISWRVLACLNPATWPGGQPPPPCGRVDRPGALADVGKPKLIH
jgi:hypothetical protein